MSVTRKFTSAVFCLLVASQAAAQTQAATPVRYLTDWPAGADPREVGKRVAEHWAGRRLIHEAGRSGRQDKRGHYAQVGTWYVALSVARLTRDTALQGRLVAKFARLRTPDGARHISDERHVDFSIFGAIPL